MRFQRSLFVCRKLSFKSSFQMAALSSVTEFIENFNRQYELKHKSFEDNFWSTKMNLAGASNDELTRTKTELDNFLGDKAMLTQVREMMTQSPTEEEMKVLKCFEKTFLCYIIEDPAALEMKDRINQLEADLQQYRNQMTLGYTDKEGNFVKKTSVQLRNMMRTEDDEETRRACYEGLRSIGPFLSEKFCEIVKLRNAFAKSQGFECFYDMKVTAAEGFNKRVLFDIMDGLERDSRPIMRRALDKIIEEKGASAVEPYNMGYFLSGDVSKLQDPYFPFENAVDAWARSFAALGITYKDSVMSLDLCDRVGKYSNGFCHWPQPAWRTATGEWIPCVTNFTSLADPKAIGSGHTALVTLMHEGGHAAHFANVDQRSPLFSQERAPTSVAYAENQSMFLDSLVSDAAWQARYAISKDGQVIPWEIIEKKIRDTQPYEVFALRAMIAVPYFEKRLYELNESEVVPERVNQLADEVEREIQGGLSARPLMSVPHILADESAAYYHGYVLAEMSVHQTRAHFLSTYGNIVDNPQVGRDLAEVYWRPGNSEPFMSLVEKLTGKPLSGEAWVQHLSHNVEEVVAEEKKEYDAAVLAGPRFTPGTPVDLQMRVLLVHGDEKVSDSLEDGGLVPALDKYKTWLSTFSM